MAHARARQPAFQHRVAFKPAPLPRARAHKAKAPQAARRAVARALPPPPPVPCPKCSHLLNRATVLAGFRDDVNDHTTQCPKCAHRFVAPWRLQPRGLFYTYLTTHRIPVDYIYQLCRAQTMHLIAQRLGPWNAALVKHTPAVLLQEHTELTVNLLAHFGSIGAALRVVYPEHAAEIDAFYA